MKYLKKFNESKYDDMISDLKDICLELSDSGFTIEFQHGYISSHLYISKPSGHSDLPINGISPNYYKAFDVKEIDEILKRIEEYLGDKWIDMILYPKDDDQSNFSRFNIIKAAEVEFKIMIF